MQNTPHSTMANVLTSAEGQLAYLIKSTHRLTDLTNILRPALTTPLAPHCAVASYNNQVLVIAVTNAAWGTRLHYQITDLLPVLKKIAEFKDLQQIEYFIQPVTQPQGMQSKESLILTSENAELLTETAHGVLAPNLKQALLRLALHAASDKKVENSK